MTKANIFVLIKMFWKGSVVKGLSEMVKKWIWEDFVFQAIFLALYVYLLVKIVSNKIC